MKNTRAKLLSLAVAGVVAAAHSGAHADPLSEMLGGGKAYGNFNLRYENVTQDNTLEDATAMTLRSRIGYSTAAVSGFSGVIEFEDNRVVLGQDEYNDKAGSGAGYSVIADPETTELDQAFVQYKAGSFTAKVGRQVITLDNHRFVGHVGWRQDRQTFDAASLAYAPTEKLSMSYSYINHRNRIFAETADMASNDHLLNAAYKTPLGTLTGYAYLLEVDNDTDNGLDTLGLRFAGSTPVGDIKATYALEYATQTSESAAGDLDTSYLLVEGGAVFGSLSASLGYEVLGSDSGVIGFATPLATLHKFNGWADTFLGTPAVGLEDLSLTVSVKAGPGMLTGVYHSFSANEPSTTVDDLGSEIDASYGLKFGKGYNAGVKYASYSKGDSGVDTDKVWLWVGKAF